jgi:hypothetical protein
MGFDAGVLRPLLLLPVFLIAACATGYNPAYRFNNVQAVNLTGAIIRDVEVSIIDSPKTLACEEVNANAMCADRFPYRRYPQQGIVLSWTHVDGVSLSRTMNPRIATFFNSTFPLRIVMEIRGDGSVNAFYEQDEPGRGGGGVYF